MVLFSSNLTEDKTQIYSWKIYFYYICYTLIYKIGDIVEGSVVVKTASLLKVMKFDFMTMQRQSNIFLFFGIFWESHKINVLT